MLQSVLKLVKILWYIVHIYEAALEQAASKLPICFIPSVHGGSVPGKIDFEIG